jgi:hypothetical protein
VFANASANNTVKCNSITAVSACMKFQSNCNPTTIYYNELNNTGGSDPCLYGIWLDANGQTGDIGYNNTSQWQMSDDKWGDFLYASGGADTYAQSGSSGSNIYYNTHGNAALYTPSINIQSGSSSYTAVTNNNTNSQNCGENARIMNPLSGGNGKTITKDQLTPENIAFRTHNSNNSLIVDAELEGNIMPGAKRIILTNDATNQRGINGSNEANFLLVDSLMTLYTQTKTLADLNSARSINAGINSKNNIEQNQKTFNAIYCTFLQKDSLVTSAQISDLQTLAWLCPFTEGLAVYNARGLVRHWDDSTFYFNTCENTVPELTGNQARFANNNTSIVKEALPTVYPNPTNGNLMVNSNCKDCIFEVYDIVGKKVMSQKLNEIETKIELNSLNAGTYLYRIMQNGISIKSDKLILNK